MSEPTRRRLVLHIGLHKTGTSAIQDAFQGYDRDGYRYADLGPINHSYAVRTAFDGPGHHYPLHRREGRSADEVDALRTSCRRAVLTQLDHAAPVLIISGEDISELDPVGLADLVAAIEASGRELEVVVYLRTPVDYASALVVESLKHGDLPRVAPRPPFYPTLRLFMDSVGRDRMTVRDYRPERFPDGDVVKDFAAVIGAAPPDRSRRVNASLSAEACAVLAAVIEGGLLRGNAADVYRLHRALVPLLEGFGTQRFRLDPAAVEDDSVGRTCDWLARTFDIHYDCTHRAPVDASDRSIAFDSPDLAALATHLGRSVRPETALAELIARARRDVARDRPDGRLTRLGRGLRDVLALQSGARGRGRESPKKS